MDSNQMDMVAQFSAVTGANPSVAQNALSAAHWNLDEAVGLYYAANDDHSAEDDNVAAGPPASSSQQGAPGPSRGGLSSSQPTRRPPGQRPKQMTLQDLQRGDDDDEDDQDDKKQDMFAGGEKSGLAVQNPNQGGNDGGPIDHFKNIMNRARQNLDRPPASDDEPPETTESNFSGRAQTLGGEGVESRVIDDPQSGSHQHPRPPRVHRTLHLWADGVSIDDGPLFRFDDPVNQDIMTQINQGRAPLSLLNVQPDQEVDLNLIPHKDENYVAPKKVYKPFGGQGQRLGSPTPGPSSSTTQANASQEAPSTSLSSNPSSVTVDESVPALTLQVRLGDGSRLQSRFNTTHTIGDVYQFVNGANPASSQRPYVLMTTFPSKELNDHSLALGDMSEFKRGGVVVQKWK